MSGVALNNVFRDVYGELSRHVLELCRPFREALEGLGVGNGNGHTFRQKLEPVLGHLLEGSFDQEPFASLTVNGVPNPRRELLVEMFRGLGLEEEEAKRHADGFLRPSGTHWRHQLMQRSPVYYARARTIHGRIVDMERDMRAPYRGTPSNPGRGVDQTVDALRRFPDLANHVYRAVGLQNTQGFPPQWTGQAAAGQGSRDRLFIDAVKEEIDDDWWTDVFCIAGLAVVAIAATVLTAGTLGPVAAGVLGAGIGTVNGGVMVYGRSQAVSEGRAAVAVGAMSPETLRSLENELQGAWGMLAVDVVTGGVIGRFGGTTAVSQIIRGTVISAAGGGLGTAMNPNVWESPNTLGLIFQGVLVGAASGAVGSGIGAGAARLLRPGAQVQFAIERGGGPLTVGRRVRVSTGRDAEAVDATVTGIDRNTNTVVLTTADGQAFTMRVDKTVALSQGNAPARVRAANTASWVRADARAPLQRAVDLGPNAWAALPNRPTGTRFQRGLSGDYSSGPGGFDEAKNLLSGRVDPAPRTVSLIHENMPPGRTTHEVTSIYSDPLSVRGRSTRVDPARGRDPNREAILDNLSLADLDGIGFFPNVSSPWQWARNYQRLLQEAAVVPTPGSRGEKFYRDMQTILGRAQWAEDHMGRRLTNGGELDAALRDLFISYGTRTF